MSKKIEGKPYIQLEQRFNPQSISQQVCLDGRGYWPAASEIIPLSRIYPINGIDLQVLPYMKPHETFHPQESTGKKSEYPAITGVILGIRGHSLHWKYYFDSDYDPSQEKKQARTTELLEEARPEIARILERLSKETASLSKPPDNRFQVAVKEPFFGNLRINQENAALIRELFYRGYLHPDHIQSHIDALTIDLSRNYSEEKSTMLKTLLSYSKDIRKGEKTAGRYWGKPDGMFFSCSEDDIEGKELLKSFQSLFKGNIFGSRAILETDFLEQEFPYKDGNATAKSIIYSFAKGLESGRFNVQILELKFQTYESAEQYRTRLVDIYRERDDDYENKATENGESNYFPLHMTNGETEIRWMDPILTYLPEDKREVLNGLPLELLMNLFVWTFSEEEQRSSYVRLEDPWKYALQDEPVFHERSHEHRERKILQNVTPSIVAFFRMLAKAKQHYDEQLDVHAALQYTNAVGRFIEIKVNPYDMEYPHAHQLRKIEDEDKETSVITVKVKPDALARSVFASYNRFPKRASNPYAYKTASTTENEPYVETVVYAR